MKKIISLVLIVTLLLSLSVVCNASTPMTANVLMKVKVWQVNFHDIWGWQSMSPEKIYGTITYNTGYKCMGTNTYYTPIQTLTSNGKTYEARWQITDYMYDTW